MVGNALFADFGASVVNPAATPVLPGEVSVSPLLSGTSLGLAFALTSSVGPGEFEDLLIRYALSGMGLSFVSNTLSMSGSSVTPDGVVTAVEDKCGGGTFGGSDPSAPCSGTLIGPLIVFDIGTIADPTETTPDFALTSFFDVFKIFKSSVCDGLNFFEKGGNSAKNHTPVLRDTGRMACGVADRHSFQSP